MSQKFVRKSLELTPEQWDNLERLASEYDATAPTGSLAGKPSWRTLIKQIATGVILLTKETK